MTLSWPVDPGYVITQPFGCTHYPAEEPLGSCDHFHRGIDLGNGTCGGPIYAAGDARVHFAGLISAPKAPGGKQSLITLDHGGGLASLYIHEAAWLVSAGDHVKDHQKIAVIGKVGAGACHCHFGAKDGVDFSKGVLLDTNGRWLDPEEVLNPMLDPASDIPITTATIASTKLYSHRDGSDGGVAWAGASGVGVYSLPANGSSNPAMPHGPVAIRVGPPIRLAWVDKAAVKLPSPATPTALGPGLYKVG